jgi:hypothetical protein
MHEIIEKHLMQVAKHVLVHIFARCYFRVFVILLRKLKLLGFQLDFNIHLHWIPWSEHSFLYFHCHRDSFTDPTHLIPYSSSRQRNHLLVINLSSYFLDDLGSDLNKITTNPFKSIGPLGKPKSNTTHRMFYAVSPEIVLWVTAMLRCLQYKKQWGSRISFHPLRP